MSDTKIDLPKVDQNGNQEDGNTVKVDLSIDPNLSAEEKAAAEKAKAEAAEAEKKKAEEEAAAKAAAEAVAASEELTDEQKAAKAKEEAEVKKKAEEEAEAKRKAEEAAKAGDNSNELDPSLKKLAEFMKETGGSLEDYVSLNRDYSTVDSLTLLSEYYKSTKPHLNPEEISFMLEDAFDYDEETASEGDIKRKKLAMKEEVAKAKQHFENAKSKYYEDVKANPQLTEAQKEAITFYEQYNSKAESDKALREKRSTVFNEKTNALFSEEFKGFEFTIGDQKHVFNVKNASEVKESQSDLNNFVGKFLNEDNVLGDAAAYHKSLFAANNADAIAEHFYNQGKADGVKESIESSKNINMNRHRTHTAEINGVKVKAVSGNNSNSLKLRIKKR